MSSIPAIGLRGRPYSETALVRMTRKTPSQLYTVTGEYLLACTALPIASTHPSMSVRRIAPRKWSPKTGSRWRRNVCSHFSRVFADRIFPLVTFRSKSDAAYSLKRILDSFSLTSPLRTFSTSLCRKRYAPDASTPSTVLRISRSFPVRRSTARPRTRKPPSFLRQTPGFEGVDAIAHFHLMIHLPSFSMMSSSVLWRRTWTSERNDTRARAGQERVERLARPDVRALTPALAEWDESSFAERLPDRGSGLEAAVPGGLRGRHWSIAQATRVGRHR